MSHFLKKANQDYRSLTRKLLGFTLIELIVAVVVIGILVALMFPLFNGMQAKARDDKRQAELSKLKLGLQVHFTYNDEYPTTTGWISIEEDPSFSQALSKTYTEAMPKDPLYPQVDTAGEKYSYYYKATTSAAFTLCAKSESSSGYLCVDQIVNKNPANLASVEGLSEAAGAGGPVGGVNWVRVLGGPNSDECRSIQQTSDEGYIVAGRTMSFGGGNDNFFLNKFDSAGVLSWSKTIGGTGPDEAHFVQQTSDGGYVIVGWTVLNFLIAKFDSSGSFVWSKVIGGSGYSYRAQSVQETPDVGGYIVAGLTDRTGSNDVFLAKLDASGNLSWFKTIGGPNNDQAQSIQQTSDGGYIVAGQTSSFGAGSYDVFLTKLDSAGVLSWSKTIGGAGADYGYSVQQTSDGGYIVAGSTNSLGAGDSDFFLAKLDSAGVLSWSKTIGGPRADTANSVRQTSDNGYIIAGNTQSFGAGGYDSLFVKSDSSGNFVWAKTIGAGGTDSARSIRQSSDGGYIVAGSTNSFGAGSNDFLIAKLNSSGDASSCSLVLSASPTVASFSPTVNNQTPAMSSFSVTVTSPSLTVTSPSPTVTNQCPL